MTCSTYCARRRRQRRSWERPISKLTIERREAVDKIPDHTPGAPYCRICDTVPSYGTNLDGVLLETCRCGVRPVVVRTPENFHRYAATVERELELGVRVLMESRPPVTSNNGKRGIHGIYNYASLGRICT